MRLAADPDRSVASVAREHHVNANQLFRWIADARRDARTDTAGGLEPAATMVPVTVASSLSPPRASSAPAAALEVEVPGARLRFDPGWEPGRVAALLGLLRS